MNVPLTGEDIKDFQTEFYIKFVDPPNLDTFYQTPKETIIDVHIHTKYTVSYN